MPEEGYWSRHLPSGREDGGGDDDGEDDEEDLRRDVTRISPWDDIGLSIAVASLDI